MKSAIPPGAGQAAREADTYPLGRRLCGLLSIVHSCLLDGNG